MENKLDGNAAAGTLQAIFPFDMTLAQTTCTCCGTTNPMMNSQLFLGLSGLFPSVSLRIIS